MNGIKRVNEAERVQFIEDALNPSVHRMINFFLDELEYADADCIPSAEILNELIGHGATEQQVRTFIENNNPESLANHCLHILANNKSSIAIDHFNIDEFSFNFLLEYLDPKRTEDHTLASMTLDELEDYLEGNIESEKKSKQPNEQYILDYETVLAKVKGYLKIYDLAQQNDSIADGPLPQ